MECCYIQIAIAVEEQSIPYALETYLSQRACLIHRYITFEICITACTVDIRTGRWSWISVHGEEYLVYERLDVPLDRRDIERLRHEEHAGHTEEKQRSSFDQAHAASGVEIFACEAHCDVLKTKVVKFLP